MSIMSALLADSPTRSSCGVFFGPLGVEGVRVFLAVRDILIAET